MNLYIIATLGAMAILFVFICILAAKDAEEREHDDYEQLEYIEKWKNKKGIK